MSYEFKFPDIGEGLTEGKILEFRVNPGDPVIAGDILAIVETDKVVAEIASPRSGVLVKFGSAAGTRIRVGQTLAYIEVADEAAGNGTGTGTGVSADGDGAHQNGKRQHQALVGTLDAAPSTLAPSDEPVAEDPAAAGSGPADPPRVTPAARRLAREMNVDLARVQPSGADGRIVRRDVEQAAAEPAPHEVAMPDTESATTTATPVSLVPVRGGSDFAFPLIDDPLVTPAHLPLGQTVDLTILRKTIAHTMETSRKIPTATIFDLGIVDELVEVRKKVNSDREVRVSFQPFFMKALATALRRYPVLNAHFNPVSEELTVFKDINIGVAVNTEAGLMVPVIHNVENKTIRQIDHAMKAMVERAKSREIRIEDLRGGTFSLTNFGPFGGLYASPMILPPQVAIIGAGRIHQAPMVVNGSVQPAWVLPVSLAFDHRVVDGVPAAEFASYVLELLRQPQELFVSM